MALEIERKFLVKNKAFLEAAERHVSICQYYLHQDESGGVRRVRFLDDKVYLMRVRCAKLAITYPMLLICGR